MSGMQHDLRVAGLVVFIGIIVVVASVIGYWVGDYLDKRFNTAPWLVITGIGLCTAGGFLEAYQIARRYFKE